MKKVLYLKYEDSPGWKGAGWYYENKATRLIGPFETREKATKECLVHWGVIPKGYSARITHTLI